MLAYFVKRVREIWKFHVVVVQRRLRNVRKSVMHVLSCCCADIKLLLFSSYLCRRWRRSSSSVLLWSRNFATMVTWRSDFSSLLTASRTELGWPVQRYLRVPKHSQLESTLRLFIGQYDIMSMVNCPHLPNIWSPSAGYEELAGGFNPIRNGVILFKNE